MDISQFTHNPKLDALAEIICQKTRRNDMKFHRMNMLYYAAKMASSMRWTIHPKDSGEMHVNLFVVSLAVSGFGKNRSINIIEESFTNQFKALFMKNLFTSVSDKTIQNYASNNYASYIVPGTSVETVQQFEDLLRAEFKAQGVFMFELSGATGPALKQFRQKILLAGCGAISLQIDEIGSNLLGSKEVLDGFLELYDHGITKDKLTKSTKESMRNIVLEGKTPANMMLFGTPSRLFDGSVTEREWFSFLETGYARRCLFALGDTSIPIQKMTPEESYNAIVDLNNSGQVSLWSDYFAAMCNYGNLNVKIQVPDLVGIELVKYGDFCMERAESIPDIDDVKKTEMQSRQSKAIKVAGVLCFLENVRAVSMDILHQAILVTEESGYAFDKIITKEENFIRLFNYIKTVTKENAVTQSELLEKLPFFRGTNQHRNDMVYLAIEYGHRKGILIKKEFYGPENQIERYYAEPLQVTDLENLRLSVSTDFARGYQNIYKPFKEMVRAGQKDGVYFLNHWVREEHRTNDNVINGFNMIVLDVDGTARRTLVHNVLEHYKFITYTTKRHTDEENRFRVIIPLKYTLKLNREEYRTFMDNFFAYLPFQTDAQASKDRCKMWTMYNTPDACFNNGPILMDPLRFLPATESNTNHMKRLTEIGGLHPEALERWFIIETKKGNRNNNLFKFGIALLDYNKSLDYIEEAIFRVNQSLYEPMDREEIKRTILTSLATHHSNKTQP